MKTIVVVDDNADFLDLVEQELQSDAYVIQPVLDFPAHDLVEAILRWVLVASSSACPVCCSSMATS